MVSRRWVSPFFYGRHLTCPRLAYPLRDTGWKVFDKGFVTQTIHHQGEPPHGNRTRSVEGQEGPSPRRS